MLRQHLDPGQFNHRLDFYVLQQQPDGQGELALDHVLTASVWARLEPQSTDRDTQSGQVVETVHFRITIRYRDDVASGCRFQMENRQFEVLSVYDPSESGRYLQCACRETGR